MLPGGHLLSVLIFFPAVGALALLFLRGDDHKFIRVIALVVSLVEFLFSLFMIPKVPIGAAGYHLEEYFKWINQPPINYHLGVDGISLFLVILTTFLTPISILASWKSIEHRVKEFFVMLLMLEVGVVGVFLSLDLFLFFLFLGSDADSHGVPDRYLGPRAPRVRRREVCPLHHGGFDPDAGGNHLALQRHRHI